LKIQNIDLSIDVVVIIIHLISYKTIRDFIIFYISYSNNKNSFNIYFSQKPILDLTSVNLGRVDLCYDQKLKINDKDLDLFFENSSKQINSKKNNCSTKIGRDTLRVEKR
jgi:hypothetical protein